MTVADFNRLSALIYNGYGIMLPLSKKTMLESRLQQRLRALNIPSIAEYCKYIFSPDGQRLEVQHMVDVVTTNTTDFFREPAHFDFLTTQILPTWLEKQNSSKPFNIWSAGCSTGEEPYTLAMTLSDFAVGTTGFDFNILGTDISGRALEKAVTAIYTEEKVAAVPLALKKRFLMKSKNTTTKTVRVIPELRSKVNFQRLNFIDGDISSFKTFNVIFCRNVLIYFDRSTQEKVIRKLCSKLEPGGILFLGHSESISNMTLPLKYLQPTTYRKA